VNYPPANVWTKVEIEVEPEPELVLLATDLAVPATWSPERQQEFLQRWKERP